MNINWLVKWNLNQFLNSWRSADAHTLSRTSETLSKLSKFAIVALPLLNGVVMAQGIGHMPLV